MLMSSETMKLTSSFLSIGLLLYNSWVGFAYLTSSSVLIHYPHLCQASRDKSGHYYPGFFCPRLSDDPEEAYCCHFQASQGSCCTQADFEALNQVNLSALPSPPILRGPGPLVALGLYGLLLAALMTTDLLHFCWDKGRGRQPRASGPARRPRRREGIRREEVGKHRARGAPLRRAGRPARSAP